MKCPSCGHEQSKVTDSRLTDSGTAVRRRRLCEECQSRWTTFERMQTATLYVQKKDGTTEPYDREKLMRGIIIACGKRPDLLQRIRHQVSELEEVWATTGTVTSRQIGEDVVEMLRDTDDIGFIRFISVYYEYQDIETFQRELSRLVEKGSAPAVATGKKPSQQSLLDDAA
ncbi:transcriptional repressor NrdR [Candidatus Peribacteria bacterium]|nr:transcriptional repressor NrdR [Candidatus Peribacteria bacterium]